MMTHHVLCRSATRRGRLPPSRISTDSIQTAAARGGQVDLRDVTVITAWN